MNLADFLATVFIIGTLGATIAGTISAIMFVSYKLFGR